MTHKRQLIRERIATVLTGLVTTGSNVFQSKIRRLSDIQLPAIMVYTGAEELVEESLSKGFSGVMQVELSIQVVVKENDNYDDVLDDILKEVQAAMKLERETGGAGSLPEITNVFFYSGLEDVDYDDGEIDTGSQSIKYMVQYEQDL